jgi:hypothetical protein
MNLIEQKRPGEFEITRQKFRDTEFKKNNDVRYDKATNKYYAKKKPSSRGSSGSNEKKGDKKNEAEPTKTPEVIPPFPNLIVQNYENDIDADGNEYYAALFTDNKSETFANQLKGGEPVVSAHFYPKGRVIVYDSKLNQVGSGTYQVFPAQNKIRIPIGDKTYAVNIENQTSAYKNFLKTQSEYLKSNQEKQEKELGYQEKNNLRLQLQSYTEYSGFNNWDSLAAIGERVDKIKSITNMKAQSKVFDYFFKGLDIASKVYPQLDYKPLIGNKPAPDFLKTPEDSELGNYSKKDLGDTGLWMKGKYFYYIPNASTASSQSYSSRDLTSAIDILLKDSKLSGRTTDNQYHALLDMYTSYFITNPRVNEICKNQNGEMQAGLESAANGLTKNVEWRKLKQILVKGDSTNKFNTGRSSFCRSSLGIPIRFKTLFDLFSELPGKPRINKNMDDWRRQTGVLQEHNIMNTVRKNLILEKKNRDQKLLKETVEIENRFQYVIESVGLTDKSDIDRIVEGVFYEMLYLENNGYNREIMTENIQSILDALGSLFGGTKNAVISTFKEKGIDYILSKLGLSKNSYMGDFLAVTFGNIDLKDIPRLFTDCDFLTKKIAESAPEAYLKNIQDEKGFDNVLMDYIRNALYDVIRESDIVQKLEERISGIICPIISGLSTKFDDKLKSIKSSLI